MSSKSKVVGGLGIIVLAWILAQVWDYFDYGSVAHQAIQVQLKLFGSAMYEFHSATGRWPAGLDDLAQTSLPRTSYVWRQTATTFVFLWPQDLKPDPNDNGSVLLAYSNVGLFNRMGRMWVCWGDLRTEHMRERDLRARLLR